MKKLIWLKLAILFMMTLVGCAKPVSPMAAPTPMLPIATPTISPHLTPIITPNLTTTSSRDMINPGESVDSMRLTIGPGKGAVEIWQFCDPFVTEPGVITRECTVPAQSILIGYGDVANTIEELDTGWLANTWTLILDDQLVNLPAFGTFDQKTEDGILRLWNVVIEHPKPGAHTLHYIFDEIGSSWDITWTFTVPPNASMDIPPGTELLSFNGTSDAFNSLLEFDSLMKSAISGGFIEPFWDAVVACGQMPLIFGDNVAVFLYRGQAQQVAIQGDFMTEYLKLGETDLWGFIIQFEPDARLEYQILLNSNKPILDPLNPLTEKGGLSTSSVVRMPRYVFPVFSLRNEGIAHGTFSQNFTITSQSLGYDVNYRVYTPAGYETLDHLPVIYVMDGQDFANPGMGAMINILDSLIADDRIKPVIAVFIDPRDPVTDRNRREDELVPSSLTNCHFCDFVALELVPIIDQAYKTDPTPDTRAIVGFSLGGNFTSQLGLIYADLFHQIAILSPYISANWIFDTYQEVEQLPLKIFISHGKYDEKAASIHLRDILDSKGYKLLYLESHEGHSYGNVRGILDDMLIYYFN